MAHLAAAARRSSALLRPTAAAAAQFSSTKWSSSSSFISAEVDSLHAGAASLRACPSFIRALRAEADILRSEAGSYRAQTASLRTKADSLRAATHDGEFLRIIDSVIHSGNSKLVEEIPCDFPFAISKKEGLTDITLTRSLKGEHIEVLFCMPKLDQVKVEESTSSSDENQEDEDEYFIPLTVTVSKSDGSSLKFACSAYPDEIVIDTLSMRLPPSGAEEEGPDLNEMDENLQEALNKYLELRGITPMNTKILHEYMISKDRRSYLLGLTKLRDFVKKD